ncbi:hypothetical protein HV824_26655 [Myxococcus sp. AM009]|uniref:hypothetical protein n=1 Tax=unclassified Myxococcus TaxID=2648731 RepID=UPI0015953673|nr:MULTISPECIES: hypothetical protein [unclassified Myxococcus]NVJ01678.1 hypothetical protein [Myxococcus sp. AM009]NVJ13418.1 hypothetical protein [Myxococcus sp. AM010]
MGLAERRIVKDFETNIFPDLKKQIDEAAGFDVPVEVKWDTLTKSDQYSGAWVASWPKIYFQPIINAFKNICVDDMGKEALAGGLKKVIIQDAKDSYSSDWAIFEGGTLTLDHQFCNADDVDDRTHTLQKTLEKAL